jgi:hypothetical protein
MRELSLKYSQHRPHAGRRQGLEQFAVAAGSHWRTPPAAWTRSEFRGTEIELLSVARISAMASSGG